ncbi:hypothetical protein DFH27DRAFT_604085 [Peziza echinospora]|nr:hypothetical protein DFH27DRAFT_604085 [Peziza echinospora]
MKISIFAATALLLSLGSTAEASPVSIPDDATTLVTRAQMFQCGDSWSDGGLRRYRFKFEGYSEANWGQDFLNGIRGRGITVHNWQCWKEGNTFIADFSTTAGLAWSSNIAIQNVIGYWVGCWPNQ